VRAEPRNRCPRRGRCSRTVEVDAHDRSLAAAALADAEQHPAGRAKSAVADIRIVRQGTRVRAGLLHPHLLVAAFDEEQPTGIVDRPRPAAVLVDAGSGVPRRRQDEVHRAGRIAPEHGRGPASATDCAHHTSSPTSAAPSTREKPKKPTRR
jgi:hypothetical protein